MTEKTRKPASDDVRFAYQLFLGREAESDQVVNQMVDGADEGWLRGFLTSDEFINGTARAVLVGAALPHQALAPRPSRRLRTWIESRVPLTPDGRANVGDADDWSATLLAIFDDETFRREVLGHAVHPITADLISALRMQADGAVATVIGVVERLSTDEIRGWVIDTAEPDRKLIVELRVDGRLIAAAHADAVQRDVQDRFGSHGRHGFTLRYHQDSEIAGAAGSLVEQGSGQTIADLVIPTRRNPPLDLLSLLRREVDEIRRMLGRIETLLPEFNGHFSYGLSSYENYFETYYQAKPDQSLPVGTPVDMAVILIGVTATPGDLARSLTSIAAQRYQPSEVFVLHAGRDHNEGERAAIARAGVAMPMATRVEGRRCDTLDWSSSLNTLIAEVQASSIMLFPACGMLATDACGAFLASLEAGAVLAYADEDRVELTADGREQRHSDPVFRTGFDRDLLQQVDCIGDVVALQRSLAVRLGFVSHPGPATLFDFLLRMGATDQAAVMHLPRILFHRTRHGGALSIRNRLTVVRQHLIAQENTAQAERYDDPIGAQPTDALRVHYRIPTGTRAAIIIPTRDRLDLLGPCLAGISNAARTSCAALDVIVVDNASMEPGTRAVLTTLEEADGLRLLRCDGAFNWSLLNNQAAAATSADVLIFLNNDTLGINRSCWDELVMQALRPHVGAVGARLLYEDGTIQHAGMVAGTWPGFLEHEGVGDAGSFPGYQGRHSLLRQVSAVTGACLATRADVFRAVGGFDETMPVQGNDADYCFRVRAAGYAVLYNPYATFYHFESKSRGYDDTDEKRHTAALVTQSLRERWEERFGNDSFYNGHFDRLAPAMTKLRPPPTVSLSPRTVGHCAETEESPSARQPA